jgi:hypothetical protein
MDNIIEFPKEKERNWLIIEKAIREQINNQTNLSDENINYICRRMKDFYLEYIDNNFSFNFKMPNDISEKTSKKIIASVQKSFSNQIHEYTNQILFERLILELDLLMKGYTFK